MSESAESDFAPSDLPRLRIHHLLALTTIFSIVMSVNLGLWRFFYSSQPDMVMPEFSSGISILLIAQLLSFSICIAVAMFGLAWRRRGLAFPGEPGHWVAIYLATVWVYEAVRSITTTFLPAQGFVHESIVLVMISMVLVFHCFAALFWGAAYWCEPARIWKWGWAAMALKSILSASWALFYIGAKCVQWLLEVFWYNHHQLNWRLILPLGPNVRMLMIRLPSYALLVFLAAAMISDLRHSRRRHWSHWLVLISTFISTAILIPYYLA